MAAIVIGYLVQYSTSLKRYFLAILKSDISIIILRMETLANSSISTSSRQIIIPSNIYFTFMPLCIVKMVYNKITYIFIIQHRRRRNSRERQFLTNWFTKPQISDLETILLIKICALIKQQLKKKKKNYLHWYDTAPRESLPKWNWNSFPAMIKFRFHFIVILTPFFTKEKDEDTITMRPNIEVFALCLLPIFLLLSMQSIIIINRCNIVYFALWSTQHFSDTCFATGK